MFILNHLFNHFLNHSWHAKALPFHPDPVPTDFDPANWKPGPVWFADTLWPSIDNLTASWTATMSNSSSVAPELADRLRKFKAITPSKCDFWGGFVLV